MNIQNGSVEEEKARICAMLDKANQQPIDPVLLLTAMKAIEGLTFEDVGGPPEEKLADIYRLAHAALNHCPNPHLDWKEEIVKTHKIMVEIGVSEP